MLVSEGASSPPQRRDRPGGHSPLPSHPQGQAVWSLLQLLRPPANLLQTTWACHRSSWAGSGSHGQEGAG